VVNVCLSADPDEVDGFRAVPEAARCYWHERPTEQATTALRNAQKLFGRIAERNRPNGGPSELPAVSDLTDQRAVNEVFLTAQRIAGEYTKAHDPWWPDTIAVSSDIAASLRNDELQALTACLRKLEMALIIDRDLLPNSIDARRQNLGPWPEVED
jgi:hypothetical protein